MFDTLLELKRVGAPNILSRRIFRFVSSSKLDCHVVDTKPVILISVDGTFPRTGRLDAMGVRVVFQ